MRRFTGGESGSGLANAEARKRRANRIKIPLVVHAVNDEVLGVGSFPGFSAAANALSTPPGSTTARLELKD